MFRNDGQMSNLAGDINAKSHTNIKKSSNFRGRLIDDVWHCDCEPRLPAVHFQTKNGGRNHGRWFYTCQKPQIKRCGFFLWDDEAKMHVAMNGGARVANGSGGADSNTYGRDDLSRPKTPTARRTIDGFRSETGLLTPDTGRKRRRDLEADETDPPSGSPTKIPRTGMPEDRDNDDAFGWDDGDDWEYIPGNLDLDTPVKQENVSESLHSHTSTKSSASQPHSASFLRTPSSFTAVDHATCAPSAEREIYPPTPTPTRFNSAPLSLARRQPDSQPTSSTDSTNCTLVTQTLALLDTYHATLPANAKDDLTGLLNTYDLRTKGIIRGRDISRLAIKKKEERIQELVGRVEVLEAEREAWRASRVKEEPD